MIASENLISVVKSFDHEKQQEQWVDEKQDYVDIYVNISKNIHFFRNYYDKLAKSYGGKPEKHDPSKEIALYLRESTQSSLVNLGLKVGKFPIALNENQFLLVVKRLTRELDSTDFSRIAWTLVIIFNFFSVSNDDFVKKEFDTYNIAFFSLQNLCKHHFETFVQHPSFMFILKALTRSMTTGRLKDPFLILHLRMCRTQLFFDNTARMCHNVVEFASAITTVSIFSEDILHHLKCWSVLNTRSDRMVHWILNVISLAKSKIECEKLCDAISLEIFNRFLQPNCNNTPRLSKNQLSLFCKELIEALQSPQWPSAISFATSLLKLFARSAMCIKQDSYRTVIFSILNSWASVLMPIQSERTNHSEHDQCLQHLFDSRFCNSINVYQQKYLYLIKLCDSHTLKTKKSEGSHSSVIHPSEWKRILKTSDVVKCNEFIKEMVIEAMGKSFCGSNSSNKLLVSLFRLLSLYVKADPDIFDVKWIQKSESLKNSSSSLGEFVKVVYEYVRCSRNFSNLEPLLQRINGTESADFKLNMIRLLGLAISYGESSELIGWKYLLLTALDHSPTVSEFAKDQCYACFYNICQFKLERFANFLELSSNTPEIIHGLALFVEKFRKDSKMNSTMSNLVNTLIKRKNLGLAQHLVDTNGILISSSSFKYMVNQRLSSDDTLQVMEMISKHIESQSFNRQLPWIQKYFHWTKQFLCCYNEKLALYSGKLLFQLATFDKTEIQKNVLSLSEILAESLDIIEGNNGLEEKQKHSIIVGNVGVWRFDFAMASEIMDSLIKCCETCPQGLKYFVTSIIRICFYYPYLDSRAAGVLIPNLEIISSGTLWYFLQESVDLISPIKLDYDCLSSVEKERYPLKTPKEVMIGLCVKALDKLTALIDELQDLDALRIIGVTMDENYADLDIYVPKLVLWCFHQNTLLGRVAGNIFRRMCRLHPNVVLDRFVEGLRQLRWEKSNLMQFSSIWWNLKLSQPQRNIQKVINQLSDELLQPYLDINQTRIVLKTLSKVNYKIADAQQFHCKLKQIMENSIVSSATSASHLMLYMFDRWLFERYIRRSTTKRSPIADVNLDLIVSRFANNRIKTTGLIQILKTVPYGSKKMDRLVYGLC